MEFGDTTGYKHKFDIYIELLRATVRMAFTDGTCKNFPRHFVVHLAN